MKKKTIENQSCYGWFTMHFFDKCRYNAGFNKVPLNYYSRMSMYDNDLYRYTLSYSAHYKYNKMRYSSFRNSNSISTIIYKKGKCIHDYL